MLKYLRICAYFVFFLLLVVLLLSPHSLITDAARMSVIDILFRVDEICKKYDKYDIEKQRQQNAYGDDAFARLYATFESEIDSALQVHSFCHFFLFCLIFFFLPIIETMSLVNELHYLFLFFFFVDKRSK